MARGEQYKDQLAAAKVSHLSVDEVSSDSEEELPEEDLSTTAGVYATATEQPRRRGRPLQGTIVVQNENHRVRKQDTAQKARREQNMERLQ